MTSKTMNIVVPFKYDIGSTRDVIDGILQLKEQWGVDRVLLIAPNKSLRLTGLPGVEAFEQIGQLLHEVIQATRDAGVNVGWWNVMTFKTGPSPYQKIVGLNGQTSAISSCPLDPQFIQGLSERIAAVARIAKPSMILLEDDYELSNHPGVDIGCFCPAHLQAFAEQQDRAYSREELVDLMAGSSQAAHQLRRKWGKLSRQTLIDMAVSIRQAVDRVSPQTRLGLCQPGCADKDGDMTQSVTKALAGPNTRPFVRLYGTAYSSNDSGQSLPQELFHALYSAQHLPTHFELVHETDTYPHTRFFASASRVQSQLIAACAFGIHGSLLHCMQYLDNPYEDPGYLNKLVKSRPRLDALVQALQDHTLDGGEIVFRPNGSGAWAQVLGRYGMPFTTTGSSSNVKFLSGNTVNELNDDELKQLLAGGLFVDGKAAWLIAERGFADCLGVDVQPGGKVTFNIEKVRQDANLVNLKSEKIYNMLFAAAGGEKYDYYQLAAHPQTQTITEFMRPDQTPAQPGLTRTTNKLGGKVAVMAGSLDGNNSSSIFSLRKREIIRQIIHWLAGQPLPVQVMHEPNVFLTANRHASNQQLILTINNLCADPIEQLKLLCHTPWLQSQMHELTNQGSWQPINPTWQDNHCLIQGPFHVMTTRIFKLDAPAT